MIKVLFFKYYYGYLTGGPSTLISILKELDKTKYYPVLVTQKESDFSEVVRSLNVEVVILPLPVPLDKTNGRLLQGALFAKLLRVVYIIAYNLRILGVIRKKKVNLIWARGTRGVLLTGIAGRLTNSPIIWDIALEYESKGLVKLLQLYCLKICNSAVAESRSHYSVLFDKNTMKKNAKKLVFISSAIPNKRIQQLKGFEEKPYGDKVKLLTVGIILQRKNQMLLLEVAKLLKIANLSFQLDVVGPVENQKYYNELIHYTRNESLSELVTFHGWQDNIAKYLDECDIFVFSSKNEGVPHVLKEAMFAKRPIISTPAGGGVSEIISQDETGIIINDYKPEIFAQEVLRLVNDKHSKCIIVERAFCYANQNFLPETECRNYEILFESLLNKKL